MGDRIILIIIIIALAIYFFYFENRTSSNQNYQVPQEYKGSEGLDYIRRNYASELQQARSLCTNQFNGNWVDSSTSIGCYNMQGFSENYCNIDIIKNLESLCISINGSPVCSSTQASCSI